MRSMRVRFLIARIGVDEPTAWYDIEAVERPAVRRVEIQVSPPDYTELKPFTLAHGQVSTDIMRGSTVHIKATLNKPVVRLPSSRSRRAVLLPTRPWKQTIAYSSASSRSRAAHSTSI